MAKEPSSKAKKGYNRAKEPYYREKKAYYRANIKDYFLTDRDIKNLDHCADTCHSNNYQTCRLAGIAELPCDTPMQAFAGGRRSDKKKSSKKGGANAQPCVPAVATKNWTTSMLDKFTKGIVLKEDEEMIWF